MYVLRLSPSRVPSSFSSSVLWCMAFEETCLMTQTGGNYHNNLLTMQDHNSQKYWAILRDEDESGRACGYTLRHHVRNANTRERYYRQLSGK